MMFRKNFSLMILAVALLSFNCSLKAMEDPQKNKQLEDRSSVSNENFYSVSKSALQIMGHLGLHGEIDLNNLELFREKLSGWATESELENLCTIFAKIKEHCAYLEQFKEHAFLEITEKNLKKYGDYLFLVARYIDLNLVFSASANYFKEITTNSIMFEKFCDSEGFYGITLQDITNLLIKIFINHSNRKKRNALNKIIESGVPSRIIQCIIKANLVDLYLLLAEGNIWPSLDAIQDDANRNLLMKLVLNCEDAELFKLIINREKAKACDWNYLFNMCNDKGLRILHYAAQSRKDILEILLELMEEKSLDLDNFIYNDDNPAIKAPIRIALEIGGGTITDLFINYTSGLKGIINKHSVYSLKFLTASRYLKALKNRELDLSTYEMPEELQFYYCALDSINKHCDLIEACKEFNIGVTQENLNNYRKLLYIIFDKENLDINLILPSFDLYFKIIIENPEQFIQVHTENSNFNGLTLTHINTFLAMLIRRMAIKQDDAQGAFILSRLEAHTLFIIAAYALQYNLDDLLLFLAREDLLIPLVCTSGVEDTFGSFFARLVIGCKNIDIFNAIIDKEKNKEYNWRGLFSIRDHEVLHYAVLSGSKEKIEAILYLMKEKNLDLANFINIQSRDGKTPLMLANEHGHSEIAELLISHGAQ